MKNVKTIINNGIVEESWFSCNGDWFLRLTDYSGLRVDRKIESISRKYSLADIEKETRISAKEELRRKKYEKN